MEQAERVTHNRVEPRAALQVGYHLLDRGSSALVAVEQTIRVLERSGLFNAGTGAHLQLDGVRRMDASIMEGESLRAGGVASIEGIVHPISAARLEPRLTRELRLGLAMLAGGVLLPRRNVLGRLGDGVRRHRRYG